MLFCNTVFSTILLLNNETVEANIFGGFLQGLDLKGQMCACDESDSLVFIGSPLIDGLDALTGRGLYISDIPIHDMTRDVMLFGEQHRAQVSIDPNPGYNSSPYDVFFGFCSLRRFVILFKVVAGCRDGKRSTHA